MCSDQVKENVRHFLMECPAYQDHRNTLLMYVNRVVRDIDFAALSSIDKMYILLGKRTCSADTDRYIDRADKTYLRKCWNKRKPSADAINDVLSTKYKIMSRLE